MKIRSCTLHVVELDSIRTIVRRVQNREENLYLLLYYFSQNLYADLTKCHVSEVVHSAMAKSPRRHHCQHDLESTSCRGQVASTAPLPA
jgi:hypothetical protein